MRERTSTVPVIFVPASAFSAAMLATAVTVGEAGAGTTGEAKGSRTDMTIYVVSDQKWSIDSLARNCSNELMRWLADRLEELIELMRLLLKMMRS